MHIQTPKQFGMSQEGNEQAITDALVNAFVETQRAGRPLLSPPPRPFHYAEIGIYTGATLRAVGEVLAQLGPHLALGVDVHDHGVTAWLPRYRPGATGLAFLQRDAAAASQLGLPWDAVFIDACHCRHCAMAEFLAFEPHVAVGGRVLFHDASPLCQGNVQGNWHGQMYIEVRKAFEDLALIPKLGVEFVPRPGWVLEADLVTVPFGVAVFRRVANEKLRDAAT